MDLQAIQALDAAAFRLVYDHTSGAAVEWTAAAITHLGGTLGGLWLVVALGLVAFRRGLDRRAGLAMLAGVTLHVLLVEGLVKHAVARPRPFLTLGLTLRESLVRPESYSFPSGHALWSWLAAWVLAARWPRLRVPLLGAAALVALSRVALGAHYPADVTVGAALGVGLGVAMARAFGVRPDGAAAPGPAGTPDAPGPQPTDLKEAPQAA